MHSLSWCLQTILVFLDSKQTYINVLRLSLQTKVTTHLIEGQPQVLNNTLLQYA